MNNTTSKVEEPPLRENRSLERNRDPDIAVVRAFVAISIAILYSCPHVCTANSNQKINGQIFIRAADGTTIKLSLTDVHVLDREAAATVLAQMRQMQTRDLSPITPARDTAEQALRKFNKELRPQLVEQERLLKQKARLTDLVIEKTHELMQCVPAPSDGPNVAAVKEEHRRYAQKEFDDLEKRLNQTSKEIHFTKDDIRKGWATGKELQNAVASLQQSEQMKQSLGAYASKVADIRSVAKTTTDADGKFTIEAPNDSVVFAFTSRTVNKELETYCWLVTLSEASPLMLTNRNTIETTATENFAADGKASLP